MVSSSYISLSDLKSLTFNEFYNRRVVISRISLLRNGGILLSQWLTDNEHLVLSSSRSSSKSKWGKQSSHLQKTAFFHAENQFSDNCPDGCLITPCYKILDSLTVEQINQTPTIAELFFGMMCAEKTGGFNLVNYRHSSGVYHEQETEDLHRRI